MPGDVTLDDLIEALSGAVIAAQDRLQKHHLYNLKHYFVEDSEESNVLRPISFTVRLPSSNSQEGNSGQANDEIPEEDYQVPLFAIASHNPLRIKDVEISFETNIGELRSTKGEEEAEKSQEEVLAGEKNKVKREGLLKEQVLKAGQKKKTINVDAQSGFMGRKGKTAHIKLRVEGGEPSEATSRMLHHLNKLI